MTVIYSSEETFWCIHSHYPSHTVSKSTELKMLPVDVNHLPVPSLHVQYIQLLPSAAAEGQARAHMFSMLWISPIVSKLQSVHIHCMSGYLHTHAYIHKHVQHVHMHIHTYVHKQMHAHTHMQRMLLHILAYTHLFTLIFTPTHAFVHVVLAPSHFHLSCILNLMWEVFQDLLFWGCF